MKLKSVAPVLRGALLTVICAALAACASTGAPGTSVEAPAGKGWKPLVASLDADEWEFQPDFWKLDPDGALHGTTPALPQHHFMYSKASYGDFELHGDFKLTGYNSGICIRLAPVDFDNVPGYQIDMGDGYWGSLWEEKGRGMVVKFPEAQVPATLKRGDWNHYYIIARGHHIEAWLNGVKTIDVEDTPGPLAGKIGFQLTHTRATDVLFKNLMIREL